MDDHTPGSHVVVLGEEQIMQIIDAIPGNDILNKIMGAATAMSYVMCKAGVSADTMTTLLNTIHREMAKRVSKFDELRNEYDEMVQRVSLRQGTQSKKSGEIIEISSAHTPTPFSETDFL